MAITKNLRLSVTPRETNKPFLDWRLGIDGPGDSNMIKLDNAWGNMKTMVDGAMAAVGHAYKAATVADMTDHDKSYVYVGSETGYTAGNWYYWDDGQSAWVSGGVYNATALQTDETLMLEGEAADAKATGEMIVVNGDSSDGTRINITTTDEDVVIPTMDDVDGIKAHFDIVSDAVCETVNGVVSNTNTGYVSANGNYSTNSAYRTYTYLIDDTDISVTATGANEVESGVSARNIGFISFLDSSDAATVAVTISGSDAAEHTETVQIPSGAVACRVCVGKQYVDDEGIPVVTFERVINVSDLKEKADKVPDIEDNINNLDINVFNFEPLESTVKWGQGALSPTTGNIPSSTNNTKIRTGFFEAGDKLYVMPKSGYMVALYAYLKSDDSFVGVWQGSSFDNTSSSIKFFKSKIPISTQSDTYKFKVVLSKTDETQIDTTMYENCLFVYSRIQALEEDEQNETAFYPFDDIPWRMNTKLGSNGVTSDNPAWAITDMIPCEPGDEVRYTGALEDGSENRLICWTYEYNENIEFNNTRTQLTFADADGKASVIMGNQTKFVRFMFGYYDESVELTKTTCKTYFGAEIKRRPEEYAKPSLSILFIGNSLALDSVSYVPSVLKSLGVDANITIGILYLGGQSLDMHYWRFTHDIESYTLYESINMTKWRSVLSDATGLDIVTFREWDIISFQQASVKAGNYALYQPYLSDLIDYINDNIDYKWKMAWNNVHSTSVHNEQTPNTPTSTPDYLLTVENYYKIINALKELLAENPVEVVFPVATATQNARATSLCVYGDYGQKKAPPVNGLLLYDGKHAQEGIACQVEGYTVAIKIMELLGIHNKSVLDDDTVIDNDFETYWNIPGKHWTPGDGPVGSTDDATGRENRRIAQRCAIQACQMPMELSEILIPVEQPSIAINHGNNSNYNLNIKNSSNKLLDTVKITFYDKLSNTLNVTKNGEFLTTIDITNYSEDSVLSTDYSEGSETETSDKYEYTPPSVGVYTIGYDGDASGYVVTFCADNPAATFNDETSVLTFLSTYSTLNKVSYCYGDFLTHISDEYPNATDITNGYMALNVPSNAEYIFVEFINEYGVLTIQIDL